MQQLVHDYRDKLERALRLGAMERVPALAEAIRHAWERGHAVFLCGNGGSAANAMHLASDLSLAGPDGGLRVEALSANPSVVTSLANDLGYDKVFAEQLRIKARPGDVLVVLSGSGNSPNVVQALEMGNARGMKTFAILGYSGGVCKSVAQQSIHFDVDDMQIAEDLQLVVGHICMQWLLANPVTGKP
jgi:D-sedoheptulose 7-phosphate isomerase